MKKTKSFYITLSVSIALLLGVFICGTIFDLQISKILVDLPKDSYYSQNMIAIIGESFGENVLYILIEVASAILFYHLLKNKPFKTWLNIILAILFACLGGFVCFYMLNKTLNYLAIHMGEELTNFLNNTVGMASIICVSVVSHALVFALFNFVKKENIKDLAGWAVAVLIIAFISNAIVQVSKHIFDRTRYRAMIYEGYTNFEYYTPWYKINHNKFASTAPMAGDYFKSFPSGHTCAAGSIFTLALLPSFVPKLKNIYWKAFFVTIACVYTFFVAISRVVAGAHFFTDVFVGGMVSIITVYLYKWLYVDRKLAKETVEEEQSEIKVAKKKKQQEKKTQENDNKSSNVISTKELKKMARAQKFKNTKNKKKNKK